MPDYSKGLIYTIRTCDNLYVGSTTNFTKRKYQHNRAIKEGASKLYQTIRNNECRWDMKPYKEFPCENKIQLTIEEERIRCELNADLNMCSCGTGLTEKEYHRQYLLKNREQLLKYKNKYYQENKEKLCENAKEWVEKNKEKSNKIKRDWANKNKEKERQYYQENKEQISEKRKEKITCECGSICRKSGLGKHKRTKKHLDWEKLK